MMDRPTRPSQLRAALLREASILTQDNQCPSMARNRALSFCQGDYVQWLDADDLLSRHKVEKQMEAAQKFGTRRTLFSSEWGFFAYRVNRAKFCRTPLWCDLSPVEWLLRKMGQNLYMQTATWLVSRELTEAAGPWDHRLPRDNDGEYFCRVIRASDGVHFVPGARYNPAGFDHPRTDIDAFLDKSGSGRDLGCALCRSRWRSGAPLTCLPSRSFGSCSVI